MKFEYDGKENARECVAFIDENGNLVIYDGTRKTCICHSGAVHQNPYTEHHQSGTKRKFYPGDKITITF